MGQEKSKIDGKDSEVSESDDGNSPSSPGSPSGGGTAEAASVKTSNSTKEQHVEDSSEFTIKYLQARNRNGPFYNLVPIDLALEAQVQEGVPTTAGERKSTSTSRVFSDVMAFLIHCPRHGRFALYTDAKSGASWLPFIRMPNAP